MMKKPQFCFVIVAEPRLFIGSGTIRVPKRNIGIGKKGAWK